jgi:GH24 family phage-related lysozyme (muramidase)
MVATATAGWALIPGATPDDVVLARTALVRPWEGRELKAYYDTVAYPPVWTICDGDTQNVRAGMVETPEGCDKRLDRRLMAFRKKLVQCHPHFDIAPLSWRASMNSLTYNAGPVAGCTSTAATLGRQNRWYDSCIAATAWNRAGGKMIAGLVARREMGDRWRIGEAELCVSGL